MITHRNNFDLIRLLAATQVTLLHVSEHIAGGSNTIVYYLGFFPGVPIFFFVSGFLVSSSFERSSSTFSYARKRALRIYPALWTCLLVSIAIAACFKGQIWNERGFAGWLAAQITLAQFYNPPFLRDFGTGVLNGSLWTITVELQFYITLVFIFRLVRGFGAFVLWFAAAVALIAHSIFVCFIYGSDTIFAKLLQVTIVPWLGLFMLGVLAQCYWPHVERWFRGTLLIWFAVYCASALVLSNFTSLVMVGNAINGLSSLLLFAVVLSAAFTAPDLSQILLRGNDFSYGIYLYHMPVVNAYLAWSAAVAPDWRGAVSAFLVTIVLAILSWFLVEKPALAYKSRPGTGTMPDLSKGAA